MALNQFKATVSGMQKDFFDLVHPIGEVYVQYPKCPSPNELWGDVSEWTDISADYAGCFFRAVGGNAANFIASGTLTPQDDMIKTHNTGNMSAHATGFVACDREGLFNGRGTLTTDSEGTITLEGGVKWAGGNNGDGGRPNRMNLNLQHYHTYGTAQANPETRPKNFSIKIWKRTA